MIVQIWRLSTNPEVEKPKCDIASWPGKIWVIPKSKFCAIINSMSRGIVLLLFSVLVITASFANVSDKTSSDKTSKVAQAATDELYDEKTDYSRFTGRVTDRNEAGNVFKITSENKNFKFFRGGDLLEFKIARKDKEFCEAFIRTVEEQHFVMYVKDLAKCWSTDDYFRRGTLLYFDAPTLRRRVFEASRYRSLLLSRRNDFLKQLNDINNFILNYNEERIKVATVYDKKIQEIKDAKSNAFDHLLTKRKDQMTIQSELTFQLDKLDKEIDYYRVEKSELFADRWNLDHDLNNPVGERPQELKETDMGSLDNTLR